jgi:alkylated DNA nucleotide flippase Atl1
MSRVEELYAVVRRIPYGTVMSYGAVGSLLTPRVSGLIAGKWLDRCPPDLPWWRVVGADGTLKIARKAPQLAVEQRRKLEEEGVNFHGDLVSPASFLPPEMLPDAHID